MDDTKTQSVPESIDAGTLADRLLGNPLPNVDYLIERLSPPTRTERETPLLEFKASYLPEEGDSSSADACKWNVVEAIVSMANATGGCILLGVKETDDHRLVACGCDPHGILDHPGRESKDLIGKTVKELFHVNGIYECDGKRSFTLNEPETVLEHVRFRLCHSDEMGDNVVAIIVSPVPEGGDPLTVKKTVSRNGEKTSVAVLFHRDEQFPRNNAIEDIAGHFSEYESYRRNRRVGRKAYAELLRPEAALWERIRRSHERLLSRLDSFEWNSFVPLDARESEGGIQPATVKPINLDSFFLPDDGCSRPDDHGGSGDHRPAPVTVSQNRPVLVAGPKSLDDLFNASRRFCLIGEPGAGKTTGIRHFVRNRILSHAQHEELFAYVPLGAWGAEGSLTGLASQTTGLSLGELEPLLSTGRAMVFLDGLNECPDEYKKDAKLQIRSFLQSHPSCGVVISARHSQEVREFGLPVWELEPFDSSRRRRFLELRLRDARKADDLISRLNAQPGGKAFLRNPLLLQMMADCVLDSPDSALPAGRAGLYRRCMDRWIVRERTKAVRAGLPDPEQTLLAAIQRLQRLAFKSRKSGLRHIPRKMVVEDAADRTGTEFPGGIDLPFVFAEENEIQFRHETFQEYFCAEWIVRHPDCLAGPGTINYGTWGMPMAFAFELFEDPCPASYFDAARKMNPWFHVAVLAGANKILFQAPTEEPTRKDLFQKAVSGKLVADDYPYVFFLIHYSDAYCFNGWYAKDDAPLETVLSSNSRARTDWTAFEHAVFRLVYGDDAAYFVPEEVGMRLVSNFLAVKLPDFVRPERSLSSQTDFGNLFDNLPFAVCCAMLASGFAKKTDFPIGFFNRFSFIFNNPTIDEYLLLSSAGLADKSLAERNRPRWLLPNVARERVQRLDRKAGLPIPASFPPGDPERLEQEQVSTMIRHGLLTKNLDFYLTGPWAFWRARLDHSLSDANDTVPSHEMMSFCDRLSNAKKAPDVSDHLSNGPKQERSDVIKSFSFDCFGCTTPRDIFRAWYAGMLSWFDVIQLLNWVCSESFVWGSGKLFFDQESWWTRIGASISSPFALGAGDIALDLPVRKKAFSGILQRAIQFANSYYHARWLVPPGLARKEQFLPRVSEWLNYATGEDVVNLAIDGWIDFETTKHKLMELNSQGKMAPAFREQLIMSIPELFESPKSESSAK